MHLFHFIYDLQSVFRFFTVNLSIANGIQEKNNIIKTNDPALYWYKIYISIR